MKTIFSLSALLTAAAFLSCNGKDGATGPQGPPGNDGVTGPAGPAGTANVISGRDTITDADWSATTTQFGYNISPGTTFYGYPARFVDLSIAQLDSAVLGSGAVLLWMDKGAGTYVQLPWAFLFVTTARQYNFAHEISLGRVRVYYFVVVLNNPATMIDPLTITQPTRIFRWVIVPPAAASIVARLRAEPDPDAALGALAARGFAVERAEATGP